MTFDLFIFDFDGTLADSGPWMIDALNEAAPRFGLTPLSGPEVEALRGLPSRAILKRLGVPLWRVPAIARHIRARAERELDPPLFDGVRAMLETLRAGGAKIAVVSSNSEIVVRRTLARDASLIDAYACSASLFGKAPLLRRVLRRTRTDRSRAIAVGDETRDIDAARRARVACGAVSWGAATPALLRSLSPDVFFESPAEIAALARSSREAAEAPVA